MKTSISDRSRQLLELRARMDENTSAEAANKKAFEDEINSSLNTILAVDDNRRAVFQFSHEEDQQNVAVCVFCIIEHIFCLPLKYVEILFK